MLVFWGPRCGHAFFEVSALRVSEHRLKTLLFQTWCSGIKGVLRWSIRFCGPRTCLFFKGCRPRRLGFRDTASRLFFRSNTPRVWTCRGPDLWIVDTPLGVFRHVGPVCFWLAEVPVSLFVSEMLDPDYFCFRTPMWACMFEVGALLIPERRLETLLCWTWVSKIKGALRWGIRFCWPKTCFCFSKVAGQGFWIFGTPRLVLFSEASYPEFWHVGVPNCELLTHRFLLLGMLGLYVFDLSGHRFWFLCLRSWAPIVDFLGTTMWAWVVRGWRLANFRKPFENISCSTWFLENEGGSALEHPVLWVEICCCWKFAGQGFWIFGTPVLVLLLKYRTQSFDMLGSRYVNCWHTASWF